jgi:hypothetical protein
MSGGALSHLRVIELGDIPASYAARQLADLGADVIKIEPPGGDPNRLLPPFAGNVEHPERSLAFVHANTNKRSIVLDLEKAADREIFSKLLHSAQLLVEATPLGYLEKFGFDDQKFREGFAKLVVVSITPFGRTGPYRAATTLEIEIATAGRPPGDITKGQCRRRAASLIKWQAPWRRCWRWRACATRAKPARANVSTCRCRGLTFTNSGWWRVTRARIAWAWPGGKSYGGAGQYLPL